MSEAYSAIWVLDIFPFCTAHLASIIIVPGHSDFVREDSMAPTRPSDAAGAPGAVFITGATGFVGMEILARYLQHTDRPVFAAVRARNGAEADQRLRDAVRCMIGTPDAYEHRLHAVPADIEADQLGLPGDERERLAEQVTDIVHSAASVSFTLSLERSREINVEGTRRMLEFAVLCRDRGGLHRYAHISTAYVAGTHRGEFSEEQLDVGQEFRNPYEQSKFEAELLVHLYDNRLPIQVFRPSIVVGERSTGWTASFNVLYTPLKAFVRGNLPALPARRSAPVDVVPVDYVADAVFKLSSDPLGAPGTYHLVAGPKATNVGKLIELSAQHVGQREPVVIPPGVFRRVVYPVLAGTSARRRRGLERTRVFFPYFAMDVSYGNANTRRRLEPDGIEVPAIESYFGRLVEYAQRARWGRAPVTRAEAAACFDPGDAETAPAAGTAVH
jgi:long-chain acyl-CoA synthetase